MLVTWRDREERAQMIPCPNQTRLAFCQRDPLRYRDLVADLLPAPAIGAMALDRYWVNNGQLVDRGGQPPALAVADQDVVDSVEEPALLACVHPAGARVKLRLEGESVPAGEADI